MAPAAYRVAYKAGPDTRRQGKRETLRRANNVPSRGVCLPDHRRDQTTNRRVDRKTYRERGMSVKLPLYKPQSRCTQATLFTCVVLLFLCLFVLFVFFMTRLSFLRAFR